MEFFQTDINWYRWALYFAVGVPFLIWLFLTPRRVLRLAAVLAILVFVQQSLASRRYIWAFGVGPALIVTYVALSACIMSGSRLPRLGALGLSWTGLLACAASGLVIGSIGSGDLTWNVISFQQLYVESALMFFFGAVALRNDEDFRRLPTLLVLIGLAVSVTHLLCIATGYRFVDYPRSMELDTYWFQYGGVFTNVNTLANALLLVIPLSVSVASDRQEDVRMRTLASAAIVPMTVSLVLTSARGPYGIVVLLITGALLMRRGGVWTAVIGAVTLAAVAAGVYALIVAVFGDAFVDLIEDLRLSGLQTDRPATWLAYLGLVASHPFGIGLTEHNIAPFIGPYGLRHELAHNIYLDIAARIGVLGVLCFAGIIGATVQQILRARQMASTLRDRVLLQQMLFVILAYPIGGFIEPIFHNSMKLTHLYFALCGLSFSLAAHVLAKERTATAKPGPLEGEGWSGASRSPIAGQQ